MFSSLYVDTSAWVDLATFQSESHRTFFNGMVHRINVFPGPGSCLGLWLDQKAKYGQGRDSDRTGQEPGASLEGAGESFAALDILPRISPVWSAHFPCTWGSYLGTGITCSLLATP